MALSYEKEQEKLLKLYDEVMTDNSPEFDDSISDDSFEEDHCEIQDINTDSEQEIEVTGVTAEKIEKPNTHVESAINLCVWSTYSAYVLNVLKICNV